MPIIDIEKSRQLEFGYGDINVSPGTLDCEDVVGVVIFRPQEVAKPIGEHEDHPGLRVDVSESPVRMTFEKIESIDVVIWALEETKRMMLEKAESEG